MRKQQAKYEGAELYKGYYLIQLDERWTVVLAGQKFGVYPKAEQARAKIDWLVEMAGAGGGL